jgi:transcriptional regulator with GAF, ATPase, and Fis domain
MSGSFHNHLDERDDFFDPGEDISDRPRRFLKAPIPPPDRSIEPVNAPKQIIGEHGALKELIRQTRVVAPTNANVLILGETGTGKELIAQAVHAYGNRRRGPYVRVNCAAIPVNLLESELFGHEKGSFTGAIARRIGRFETAQGGTLFLDEVGDIPLELQPKLLRVLQEREFERVGSSETRKTDVRIVAATCQDLGEMVRARQFRADLFYRLNVFPLTVPPLRERAQDIPALVSHFSEKYSAEFQIPITSIPQETLDALVAHDWPGNIRELENVVERSVLLSEEGVLRPPADFVSSPGKELPAGSDHPDVSLADVDRSHILRVLQQCNHVVGGPAGAASRLGLKRTTLISRMKKLGVLQHAS